MSFLPVNGDHALQTITFQVTLSRPTTQADLNSVRAKHKNWRAELPAISQPQWASMQVEEGQPVPKMVLSPGLEFSFLRPDGSSAWAVRLLGSDIVVECNRYTRWARTWPRGMKYILQMLEILAKPDPERQIVSCSMIVLDRFFSSDLHEGPAELLKRSELVSEKIFIAGPSWHQHSGWFEYSAGVRILNQLNLESKSEMFTQADGDTSEKLFVSIHHHQTWQLPVAISARSEVERQLASIDSAMTLMHEQNKSVLALLLQANTLEQIGFHTQNQVA